MSGAEVAARVYRRGHLRVNPDERAAVAGLRMPRPTFWDIAQAGDGDSYGVGEAITISRYRLGRLDARWCVIMFP